MAIAHFNVARLLHPPGDPRVAEFTTNTLRVNAVAERSPGFIWRWKDEASTVDGSGGYQAVEADPNLAISLSVWESVEAFRFFVQADGARGFPAATGGVVRALGRANYVIWPCQREAIPTVADGWARLERLANGGPSPEAYDLHWAEGKAPG